MKRLNTLAPNRCSNDWNEGSARTASLKCPSKSEFFDSIGQRRSSSNAKETVRSYPNSGAMADIPSLRKCAKTRSCYNFI